MLLLARKSRLVTVDGLGVHLHARCWPRTQRLRTAAKGYIMATSVRQIDPNKLQKVKQVQCHGGFLMHCIRGRMRAAMRRLYLVLLQVGDHFCRLPDDGNPHAVHRRCKGYTGLSMVMSAAGGQRR